MLFFCLIAIDKNNKSRMKKFTVVNLYHSAFVKKKKKEKEKRDKSKLFGKLS